MTSPKSGPLHSFQTCVSFVEFVELSRCSLIVACVHEDTIFITFFKDLRDDIGVNFFRQCLNADAVISGTPGFYEDF